MQISNKIQNDAIMLKRVLEYCNRVNSRLVVIKFNAACWYQYWEYTGIYIDRQVHHVADIKMTQNDIIIHESSVEYCYTVNSRFVVIKFNTAFWNPYWEYSGIYIER